MAASTMHQPEEFCGPQTFIRQGRLRSGVAQPGTDIKLLVTSFDGSDADRLATLPNGQAEPEIHVSVFYAPPLASSDDAKQIGNTVIHVCLRVDYLKAKEDFKDDGIRFWVDHDNHYCHGIFFYPCPIGTSKPERRARSDFRNQILYPKLLKLIKVI